MGVLSITEDDVLASFNAGGANLTALSLGSGYMIPSAAPHMIINGFKNLAGAAIAADYSFPALDALKAAAKAAPAGGEAKKDEPEEEEDEDIDMGGMFGDDDDY